MKVTQLPPIPGQDDLFGLIAFLRNPDAVEKHLKALDEARQDINRRLVAVKDLSEIEDIRNEAVADRKQAELELRRAHKEAAGIMQDAKTGILADNEAIQAEGRAIKEARAKLSEDTAEYHAQRRELSAEQQKLATDRAELARREQAAATLMEQANKKMKAVNQLLSQSREVLSA